MESWHSGSNGHTSITGYLPKNRRDGAAMKSLIMILNVIAMNQNKYFRSFVHELLRSRTQSLAKVNNVVLINCTSRPIYGVRKKINELDREVNRVSVRVRVRVAL